MDFIDNTKKRISSVSSTTEGLASSSTIRVVQTHHPTTTYVSAASTSSNISSRSNDTQPVSATVVTGGDTTQPSCHTKSLSNNNSVDLSLLTQDNNNNCCCSSTNHSISRQTNNIEYITSLLSPAELHRRDSGYYNTTSATLHQLDDHNALLSDLSSASDFEEVDIQKIYGNPPAVQRVLPNATTLEAPSRVTVSGDNITSQSSPPTTGRTTINPTLTTTTGNREVTQSPLAVKLLKDNLALAEAWASFPHPPQVKYFGPLTYRQPPVKPPVASSETKNTHSKRHHHHRSKAGGIPAISKEFLTTEYTGLKLNQGCRSVSTSGYSVPSRRISEPPKFIDIWADSVDRSSNWLYNTDTPSTSYTRGATRAVVRRSSFPERSSYHHHRRGKDAMGIYEPLNTSAPVADKSSSRRHHHKKKKKSKRKRRVSTSSSSTSSSETSAAKWLSDGDESSTMTEYYRRIQKKAQKEGRLRKAKGGVGIDPRTSAMLMLMNQPDNNNNANTIVQASNKGIAAVPPIHPYRYYPAAPTEQALIPYGMSPITSMSMLTCSSEFKSNFPNVFLGLCKGLLDVKKLMAYEIVIPVKEDVCLKRSTMRSRKAVTIAIADQLWKSLQGKFPDPALTPKIVKKVGEHFYDKIEYGIRDAENERSFLQWLFRFDVENAIELRVSTSIKSEHNSILATVEGSAHITRRKGDIFNILSPDTLQLNIECVVKALFLNGYQLSEIDKDTVFIDRVHGSQNRLAQQFVMY